MIKLALVLLACFGIFTALGIWVPGVWHTAFNLGGVGVPWIAIGTILVGFVSWKKIGN